MGGWVGVGSNPGRSGFFFLVFFTDAKCRDCTFRYVWACYFLDWTCRETLPGGLCLQTLLWPWKVHQPSSWSLYLSEFALKWNGIFFFAFFFYFLFFNGFFGLYWRYFQHLNSFSKVGYLWDLIKGPLNLASDALPTELRGTSLQGNS